MKRILHFKTASEKVNDLYQENIEGDLVHIKVSISEHFVGSLSKRINFGK